MANLVVWSKPRGLRGCLMSWKKFLKTPAYRALESTTSAAQVELKNAQSTVASLREQLAQRNIEAEKKTAELDNILSSLELPMIMVDRALRVTKFNRAAHLLFSVSDDDIGFPITQVRARFEIPFLNSKLLKVMEQGDPLHRKISDQQMGTFKHSIVPYKDARGQICGAIISFTALSNVADLTDKTLESPALFRAAQRLANIGSFYWAVGHEEVHFSDQLHSLCGQNQSQSQRQTLTRFIDMFYPEDRAALRSEIATALQYKRGFSAELRINQPDSAPRLVQVEALYQRSSLDDRQAEILMGLIKDASGAGVKSKKTKTATGNAVTDAAIIDAIGQPVALLSMDGTIRRINKAAEKTFGYPAEEIVGQSINELMVAGHTGQSWFKPFKATLSNAANSIVQAPLSGLTKNGRAIAMDVSIYHVPKAGDNGDVLVATLVDQNQRQAVKKQLQQMTEAYQAARSTLQQTNLSYFQGKIEFQTFRHSLNAPLSIVGDLAAVVANEVYGNLNENYIECGETITSRVAELKSYIRTVNDLAAIDHVAEVTRDTVIDLRDVSASIIESYSADAHDKEISLGVDIAPSLPKIRAEQIAVEKIVSGMMGYALEAAGEGENITLSIQAAPATGLSFALNVSASAFDRQKLLQAFDGLAVIQGKEFDNSLIIDTAASYERMASVRLTLAQRYAECLGGQILLQPKAADGFTLTLNVPSSRVVWSGIVRQDNQPIDQAQELILLQRAS